MINLQHEKHGIKYCQVKTQKFYRNNIINGKRSTNNDDASSEKNLQKKPEQRKIPTLKFQ